MKIEVSSGVNPDADWKKPAIYADRMQTIMPAMNEAIIRRAFPLMKCREIARGTAMHIRMFSAYIIVGKFLFH